MTRITKTRERQQVYQNRTVSRKQQVINELRDIINGDASFLRSLGETIILVTSFSILGGLILGGSQIGAIFGPLFLGLIHSSSGSTRFSESITSSVVLGLFYGLVTSGIIATLITIILGSIIGTTMYTAGYVASQKLF
jgi:hypothetical protein